MAYLIAVLVLVGALFASNYNYRFANRKRRYMTNDRWLLHVIISGVLILGGVLGATALIAVAMSDNVAPVPDRVPQDSMRMR